MVRDTRAHIGHLAGLVYQCLKREGIPLSVLDLAYKNRIWPWDVLLALGWLSREDKVSLHKRVVALMASPKE